MQLTAPTAWQPTTWQPLAVHLPPGAYSPIGARHSAPQRRAIAPGCGATTTKEHVVSRDDTLGSLREDGSIHSAATHIPGITLRQETPDTQAGAAGAGTAVQHQAPTTGAPLCRDLQRATV